MRKLLLSVASACAAVGAWSAVEVADDITVTRDASSGAVTVAYSLTATADETKGIVTADLIGADGAVIPGALAGATGAVFRCVSVGPTNVFVWKPDAAAAGASTGCSFRVTAWNLASPPDYLSIDLTGAKDHTYYENAGQVPGGVKDRAYFLHRLLMRKIPAAQVEWHQGNANASAYSGEQIQRWTTLTADYYIGVYEVTRAQYWFVDTAQTGVRASAFRKTDVPMLMPVQGVDYTDIYGSGADIDSSKWLGMAYEKTGVRLNLPTEAQWEYACRAGTSGATYATRGDVAVYGANAPLNEAGKKIPAIGGTKLPNDWGLYDTIGNVYEFVRDWLNPEAHLDSSAATDPTGPEEYIDFNAKSAELGHATDRGHAGKMWRGGCYEYNDTSLTSASYPYGWGQWGSTAVVKGFRVICPVQ